MARKRMIDPQIWTSEDFSKLTPFARLLWIGLISQADDEGRGKLNTAYLKSQLFPYDEKLSTKQLECALNEIKKHMSVEFYEVDGKRYYQLDNWKKFQTINKPTPSQIPNFSNDYTQQFTNDYGSATVVVCDDYRLKEKEIEKNMNEKENLNACTHACEEEFLKTLSQKYPKLTINSEKIDTSKYNLDKILLFLEKSKYLQGASTKFILDNYDKVISNAYVDFSKPKENNANFTQRTYSKEELDNMFDSLDEVDI